MIASTRPSNMTAASEQAQRADYPADWPSDGPIDLGIHDLPHASSTLEWWYVNAHLTTDAGREVSVFASFFRTAVGRDELTGENAYAHALTWAYVEPAAERYTSESLVDHDAPAIALAQLDRGMGIDDPLLRRAMTDVLERGEVPRPDRVLGQPCGVAQHRLSLDYDGRCFERLGTDRYRLELFDASRATMIVLTLRLDKPVTRHGADGLVHGKSGEDMFYYFSPRCAVEGTITLDGLTERVVGGNAWYDHEFGRGGQFTADGATELETVSWDWISAQFDNGWDLSIYCMVDDTTGESCGRFAVLVDPAGQARTYTTCAFEGRAPWTSSKTFVEYPTAWQISVPEAGLTLDARAAFPAQELITVISRPSFWEGRVDVRGHLNGTPINGKGFVERSGFGRTDSIKSFFSAVGAETRRSVRAVLPLDLDQRSATRIVGGPQSRDYLNGVDLEHLSSALIAPIRTIVDRGGKAWRSYVALASCDAVGGDSQPHLNWLAMPELMHVGSLLVDDVQDRSQVRRGGPAAHTIYGEALTINAGTLCYFLPQLFLSQAKLSPAQQVRIYELYFEAARAAHAGQALDLAGFAHCMPDLVARGDGAAAAERVRAVHRLKSAAPAGCLARVGAIVGGGTEPQIEALGTFVEHVGLAFQIVDDVLNLRGFSNDLKQRGEDLGEGKVTMPVARAIGMLDAPERTWLWNTIAARPTDPRVIDAAIDRIEACGALRACQAEAEQLVEDAWITLDPLVPNSMAKLMLRAFSWFVLERHY